MTPLERDQVAEAENAGELAGGDEALARERCRLNMCVNVPRNVETMFDRRSDERFNDYPATTFFHVSFNVAVRLNTTRASFESGSTQK